MRLVTSLPGSSVERVETTVAALALRDAYLAAGIVAPKWANDALHVALATASRADAIASWSFRHIVRLDRIRLYNAVNLTEGYGLITILSPRWFPMTATRTETETMLDCIAFKRAAQERIHSETAGMTHAEFAEYLRRNLASGPFAHWFDSLASHERGGKEKPPGTSP